MASNMLSHRSHKRIISGLAEVKRGRSRRFAPTMKMTRSKMLEITEKAFHSLLTDLRVLKTMQTPTIGELQKETSENRFQDHQKKY